MPLTRLPAPVRRSDAETVRIGKPDITGLMLCGAMYVDPYDLLAPPCPYARTGYAASSPDGAPLAAARHRAHVIRHTGTCTPQSGGIHRSSPTGDDRVVIT
jgi:hypothetical protein